MASFKATIFQKNINSDIAKDQKQKVLMQKSDFLILPEYYPLATKNTSLINLASNSRKNIDNLIDLSLTYKGVIIGGSFIREDNGKYYHSCPIVLDGALVDWYNQKIIKELDQDISKGNLEEGIYILNGIRFALMIGKEISDNKLLEYYKNENIQILFHLESNPQNSHTFAEDLKQYSQIASENQMYIFRTCGTGLLFEKQLIGRSLFASPAGINWKVAPAEKESEIIKTINLNF